MNIESTTPTVLSTTTSATTTITATTAASTTTTTIKRHSALKLEKNAISKVHKTFSKMLMLALQAPQHAFQIAFFSNFRALS